jgi:hypothetical protein
MNNRTIVPKMIDEIDILTIIHNHEYSNLYFPLHQIAVNLCVFPLQCTYIVKTSIDILWEITSSFVSFV